MNGVQQIPGGGGGQGPPHQQGHPGGGGGPSHQQGHPGNGGGPPVPGQQQQQQQQGIPQGLMGMHGGMTQSQLNVCVYSFFFSFRLGSPASISFWIVKRLVFSSSFFLARSLATSLFFFPNIGFYLSSMCSLY